jgi:hypothetical protein
VLDTIEIMSGFTNIRAEFRTKLKITKPAYELALWFTFNNEILYVHDMEEHKISMALASLVSKEQNNWKIYLKPNSAGEALIRKAVLEENYPVHTILNEWYSLTGFVPLSLKK